jgi:hypothetical protein
MTRTLGTYVLRLLLFSAAAPVASDTEDECEEPCAAGGGSGAVATS